MIKGQKYFSELIFSSWFREPDYGNDYKELWKLDCELSTVKPNKFELASIWRLARDSDYAPWLKLLGLSSVQITLFGGEEKTLVKEGVSDINSLWKMEKELLPDLLNDETPPNDTPDLLALMVSNEFNVYPNSGEMLDYANLGNLITDGIDVVMDNFINRKTHSLKMNYETPVNYFAQKYGDKSSETLTSRYELCKKWLHMEAENECLQKEQ